MVQSVARALMALELVAEYPGQLSMTELGRRLGVHKATASRLISTLADQGLVERDATSDKYRPGYGLLRLAAVGFGSLDIVRQAKPVLADLAKKIQETVNLAVLEGDRVINLDQVTGSQAVVSVNWVGQRTPLHCTSNGKILLAYLPKPRQDALLRPPLEHLTAHTITDPQRLRSQLREAVERGYAYTLEELEVGLNAVAAPVRNAVGEVTAAVSVAGPAYRLARDLIPELGKTVVQAGDEISRRMGFAERSAV